jgi:hypothetical protein
VAGAGSGDTVVRHFGFIFSFPPAIAAADAHVHGGESHTVLKALK